MYRNGPKKGKNCAFKFKLWRTNLMLLSTHNAFRTMYLLSLQAFIPALVFQERYLRNVDLAWVV